MRTFQLARQGERPSKAFNHVFAFLESTSCSNSTVNPNKGKVRNVESQKKIMGKQLNVISEQQMQWFAHSLGQLDQLVNQLESANPRRNPIGKNSDGSKQDVLPDP